MFRKMYDSLSMPVHVELLVQDESVCLKTWVRVTEDVYNMTYEGKVDENDSSYWDKNDQTPSRSLLINHNTPYMELPGDAVGVYHTKLPAGRFAGGTKARGEDFIPNIPSEIRASYETKLAGTYWQCNSYSWIDPTDPSIMGGEQSDAACWSVGIGSRQLPDVKVDPSEKAYEFQFMHNYPAFPSINALALSKVTKGHPLRESRRYGAPASLFVYQPFTDTNFTDCSITLKYNRGSGFSTNVDGWVNGVDHKEMFNMSGTGYNYLGHLKEALPSFEVVSGGGSIDADGYDTVNFKMTDVDGVTINHATSVYLENSGGYLPKSRVDITDGTGSFKVGALGMDSGDTFKVKIGFRNYTGLADVEYTVA
tara:strand:- start:1924 stop:3021 length:1098 start_codon:yes stop_codon:yes gene_type:complete